MSFSIDLLVFQCYNIKRGKIMELVNPENILNLLFSYNPWWQSGIIQQEFNKPMKRFAYYEAMDALDRRDVKRSVILCGARRTGKTTIMYQAISE